MHDNIELFYIGITSLVLCLSSTALVQSASIQSAFADALLGLLAVIGFVLFIGSAVILAREQPTHIPIKTIR